MCRLCVHAFLFLCVLVHRSVEGNGNVSGTLLGDIRILPLDEPVRRVFESLIMRIEQHDAKLQNQEIRLQQQDARLQNQETRLQQQDARLQNQETRLQQQDARLQNQEMKLQQQRTQLQEQERKHREHEAMLQSQVMRVKQHETRLQRQDARLQQEETRHQNQETTFQRAILQHQKKVMWHKETKSHQLKKTVAEMVNASKHELDETPPDKQPYDFPNDDAGDFQGSDWSDKTGLNHDRETAIREIVETSLPDLGQKEADGGSAISKRVPPISSESVAFHVSLRHDIHVSANQVVVYNVVMTNVGNGYNNDGVFVVPVSGTYVFTWSTIGTDNTETSLRVNGSKRGSTFCDSSSGEWDSATGVVVVSVNAADLVAISADRSSTIYSPDQTGYDITSTFSGWRLF